MSHEAGGPKGTLCKSVGHGSSVWEAGSGVIKEQFVVFAEGQGSLVETFASLRVLFFHEIAIDKSEAKHDKRIVIILVATVSIVVPATLSIVVLYHAEASFHVFPAVWEAAYLQGKVCDDLKKLPVAGTEVVAIAFA